MEKFNQRNEMRLSILNALCQMYMYTSISELKNAQSNCSGNVYNIILEDLFQINYNCILKNFTLKILLNSMKSSFFFWPNIYANIAHDYNKNNFF